MISLKHCNGSRMLGCGMFWGDSKDICYFFNHLGYKDLSTLRNDSCQQKRLFIIDYNDEFDNRFRNLARCWVSKKTSGEHVHR